MHIALTMCSINGKFMFIKGFPLETMNENASLHFVQISISIFCAIELKCSVQFSITQQIRKWIFNCLVRNGIFFLHFVSFMKFCWFYMLTVWKLFHSGGSSNPLTSKCSVFVDIRLTLCPSDWFNIDGIFGIQIRCSSISHLGNAFAAVCV